PGGGPKIIIGHHIRTTNFGIYFQPVVVAKSRVSVYAHARINKKLIIKIERSLPENAPRGNFNSCVSRNTGSGSGDKRRILRSGEIFRKKIGGLRFFLKNLPAPIECYSYVLCNWLFK